MLAGSWNHFEELILCSRLWLEVHTHYGQLSPLLRHALSFLGVAKLPQPASPTGASCLGDPTPSRQEAACLPYVHLHRVWAGLQQPASAQSSWVGGTKCTCPSLRQPGYPWNNTIVHMCSTDFPQSTVQDHGSHTFLNDASWYGPKPAGKSRMNIKVYTSGTK